MDGLQISKGIKRSQPDNQGCASKKSRKKTGSVKLLPRRIERLLRWKEKHKNENNDNIKNCLNQSVNKELLHNSKMVEDGQTDKTEELLTQPSTSNTQVTEKCNGNRESIVALDCEMVGTGSKGRVDALARCSIVDFHGNIIYDKYVKPQNLVTDYRTKWSGIREENLKDAVCFNQAQTEVQEILRNKIVVGHSLHHDFAALKLNHPKHSLRDTAEYKLMKELTNIGESSWTPSLRYLVRCLLGRDIQVGEHCSVDDARSALDLYKLVENQWEENVIREKRDFDGKLVSYMDDEFWPPEIFH
ncbi:RNA exonuclease 4-like [Anneissia japonica]|uniref:RNA exonuclease 4-like n=1 Tax=Anneissia japonica TaxID=1529436 RepID=UPI00142593B5|nr:RNA exonuclease 4-like [Anneissia japonica]